MPDSPATLCFVGLGNPGREYERTRHNLGFQTIDRLAQAAGIRLRHSGFFSRWGEGFHAGRRVLLFKPQTYMNLSGRAVAAAVAHFGLEPTSLWVIYDDLDLEVGRLRIRAGGGAGGHRGVQSIIELLGTRAFGRIRIGIGRPPAGVDPAEYVLQAARGPERRLLEEAVERAAEAALTIISAGPQVAMNRFNQPQT